VYVFVISPAGLERYFAALAGQYDIEITGPPQFPR
jgi:hypothetical protein